MSPTDDRSLPEWLRIGPVTSVFGDTGDGDRRLDLAWRLWDRLRVWDRRYAYVVDTVLAVGLFVLGSGWIVLAGALHPNLGFVAALTLPLILRRRAPIAVFGIVAVVALVQWLSYVPLLADASLLIALYTVVAESHWVQAVTASVLLEVGVIMATVHWIPTGSHLKSFVFLTGLAFAALLTGVVVRALRSRMGWLAERAQRLELERDQQASLAAAAERARIAREMHDVVSHNLQVMVTLADAAGAAPDDHSGRVAETMGEVSSTGRQALLDMRRMLGVLRDETSIAVTARAEQTPLSPQPGLGELEALIDRVRATGLAVSVEESGQHFGLSEAAELTIYRIVQEALTNALKHAMHPRSVTVSITYEDPEVRVRVTDDGAVTGAHGVAAAGGGHGVTGMSERAAAFGGTLQAGPRPEGGWQVEATLCGCRAPVHA
jgi:signal transduction histidine kinase